MPLLDVNNPSARANVNPSHSEVQSPAQLVVLPLCSRITVLCTDLDPSPSFVIKAIQKLANKELNPVKLWWCL